MQTFNIGHLHEGELRGKEGEGGICSKGANFWYVRKYGSHDTFILQALRSMEVWQLSIVAKTDTNSTMIAM